MLSNLSRIALRGLIAVTILSLAQFVNTARAGFITTGIGGSAAPSSIQATVDSFRASLGLPDNGNSGPQASGHREINWDGGGVSTSTSNTSPLTTFTNTRGSTFTTAGTGFLQTPLTDPALTGINASYSTTFGVFSAQRLFTPTGSNVTDVTFFVPGSNGLTPATVGGFGAVFSDVDLANITRIEFFNAANLQIFSVNVSPGTTTSQSLSFMGAIGNAGEKIFRVRITTGNAPLGPAPNGTDSNGNPTDVVTMDDFLYSEPIAVPEPASLTLAGIAALLSVGLIKRRRR